MKDLTYYLSCFVFNFSDRFEVFEFYFTWFLKCIELHHILKTLDFKIIPRSRCSFVFWSYPPGSVFLIPSFASIRQSKYAIFYMQAVCFFTDTGYAHWKDLSRQRPSGKCLALNFSDRFRVVFEFYFTGLLNGIELYNILKTRFKNYSKVMMQLCILILSTWVSLPHSFICTCQAVPVCLFFLK